VVEIDHEMESILLEALGTADAEDRGPRTHLWVSEVGTVYGPSACHRKLWYAFHDAPRDPIPVQTLMAFEVGDVVHIRISTLLASTGRLLKREVYVDLSPWPVKGRLDILTDPRLRRIVEVKTIPYEMHPHIPKEEHIHQLLLYMHYFRMSSAPDYEELAGYDGSLVYISKNSRKGQPVLWAYRVQYDPARVLSVLGEFLRAYWTARGEEIPERPKGFTHTKYPCAYCVFQTTCWSRLEGR